MPQYQVTKSRIEYLTTTFIIEADNATDAEEIAEDYIVEYDEWKCGDGEERVDDIRLVGSKADEEDY